MCKKYRLLLFLTALLLFTVTTASFQGRLSPGAGAAEQGCITSECHPAMLTARNVHVAAHSCDNCHEPAASPHPQHGKKTFRLVQEGGALCAMCHPDKQTHAFVHGPVGAGDCTVCHNPHESSHRALTLKSGSELCADCHTDIGAEIRRKVIHPPVQDGCTACHNPHGSPYRKLLTADGESLCFQCHPDVGETIEKGKSIHAPLRMEKGCMACHAPHASEGRKLLQKGGKDLCLECHGDVIKKSYPVIHGPMKEGNCTACHNPHASAYGTLLGKSFPDDIYGSYSDKEYELCFTCHKRDLVRFPDTSFATGFRDGEKNLHYLHVRKKEKGRSCKACHTPHGGGLPKLMADKVKFGKWELPLNFVQTDTGGSCAPGCHKKYAYDRKSAAREEESLLRQEKPATGEEAIRE